MESPPFKVGELVRSHFTFIDAEWSNPLLIRRVTKIEPAPTTGSGWRVGPSTCPHCGVECPFPKNGIDAGWFTKLDRSSEV